MSLASKFLRKLAAKSEKTVAKTTSRAASSPVKRRTAKEIMSAVPEELESYAVKRAKRKDTATVNIGLKPSKNVGGGNISKTRAIKELRATGRRPFNVKVVTSGSEPTLVADIRPPLSAAETSALSGSAGLRQDAIAQRLPTQGEEAGLLAGPRAQDWGGSFSPGYFYLQGGDTLGSGLMTDRFRAGAPVDDINALADKWGIELDPVNLAVNARMRDQLLQRGDLPSDFGVFTGKPVARDPEALRALQSGEGPVNFEGLQIGPQPKLQGVGARGVHISRSPGLEQLDPAMFGRGHQGEEYRAVKQLGLPKRSYMYSGPEGTIAPEPAVLGVEGDKMVRGPRYAYEASLQNLYDIDADPEQLNAMAQLMGGWPDMERWAQQRGYAGYLTDQGPSWDRQSRRAAALYGPTDVSPIDPEPIADWRRKFAVGGRV